MKVIEIPLEDIVINPAIATRKGGHDPESVARIAKSYVERHEQHLDPVQIMPGLVRALDGKADKYELIDGGGRFEACKDVNASGGLDGEPMMFRAQVARAGDTEAVISGIQANFHDAVDVFDRADAMQKLLDLGQKQKDIARIFAMSEGTVSQMLKLNSVPKKYIKAVRDGDLEQDAAIFIAGLDADNEDQRNQIFEEAVRHRQRYDELMAKVDFKAKKAAADAAIEEAKAKSADLAAKAKEAEKAAKEADKALSKAKDEKETAKLRKEKEAADAAKREVGKAWAQAEKELVKAKESKEKLAAKSPSKKSKATVEDVKEAAKSKGKNVGPTPRTKNQFLVALEAITEDGKKPLPQSAKDLIGKIEGYLEGDYTEEQLANAFRKYCVE